jgi:hypothetical protein
MCNCVILHSLPSVDTRTLALNPHGHAVRYEAAPSYGEEAEA